jgi:multimeric flavodoxin WrbA
VLILGSPIYFGTGTGEMKSFMERLMFPYLAYASTPEPIFTRRIRTACIYTMNAPEDRVTESWTRLFAIRQLVSQEMLPVVETYQSSLHMAANEYVLKMIFGSSESLLSYQTYQFEDYSKVVSSLFDPEQRAQRRKEVFPVDCRKAFEMGARLTGE